MEFYVQQAVSAIREQVSKLRESGHPANVSLSSEPLGWLPTVLTTPGVATNYLLVHLHYRGIWRE